MSSKNFQDVLDSLLEKINNLELAVTTLNQEIAEQQISFELKKNDIQKEASSLLRGYDPSGIGLYLPSTVDFNLEMSDITNVLKNVFKI